MRRINVHQPDFNRQFCTFHIKQVVSEEPVFEAVMSWVRHDEEKRNEHLSNLLKHVRLPLLSAKYLTDQVDEEVSKNEDPNTQLVNTW